MTLEAEDSSTIYWFRNNEACQAALSSRFVRTENNLSGWTHLIKIFVYIEFWLRQGRFDLKRFPTSHRIETNREIILMVNNANGICLVNAW